MPGTKSSFNECLSTLYTCCCSVTQSCLTLCDPMDCSMPGLPVSHHVPVCPSSCPLNWWCCANISSSATFFSFCLQYFPASGSFPMSQLLASRGQSTGASASASVLPISIQGWFPLRLTGWIAKGLLGGSSPAPQFESISSLVLCLLYGPALTSEHDYWKHHNLDYMDLCQQSDVSAFTHSV